MRISDWSSDVCSSDLAPLVSFVMGNAKPARHRILAADTGERQEHQRVLQALALVQGDALDAAPVRFEAQELGLIFGHGVDHEMAAPVYQSIQAAPGRLRLLQSFGTSEVVSLQEPP